MMAGFDDLIIATMENADDSELSGSDDQIFMYSFFICICNICSRFLVTKQQWAGANDSSETLSRRK